MRNIVPIFLYQSFLQKPCFLGNAKSQPQLLESSRGDEFNTCATAVANLSQNYWQQCLKG